MTDEEVCKLATQYIVFTNFFNAHTMPVLSRALTDAACNTAISDICLVVASQGGGVTEGIGIHELIKTLPKPVAFQAIGNIDSIAITVMLACGDRYASPVTRYMFHPLGGGAIESLTVTEGQRRLDSLLKDQNRLKSIYSKSTSISETELDELFERQLFHDNSWAIKNGFISSERQFTIPFGSAIVNAS